MKKILISLSIILLFCCPAMSFAKFSLGTSVFKQSVLENNLYVLGSGKTLEEAMTLVTDDSATSIRSMKKLYKQREELNKRYVFVNKPLG